MPRIRAPRVEEERRLIPAKKEVTDFAQPRKGLREVSNLPSAVTKKVGDLKLVNYGISKGPENSNIPRRGAVCTSQKLLPNAVPCAKENPISSSLKTSPKKQETASKKQEAPVIEDIDNHQVGTLVLVSGYAKDVYSYLMKLEQKFSIETWPLPDCLITPHMRAILVDWMAEISDEFKVLQDTFHIAISLLDRFLQVDKDVNKTNFQLVGISALFLASKYEELYCLNIEDLVFICHNAYTKKELLEMEKKMFKALNYNFGKPCSPIFLRRFNMAARAEKLQHCYSKYLIDLALMGSQFCHLKSSLVAAASSFLGMCLFKKKYDPAFWTPMMEHYSTYKFSDIRPVLYQMVVHLIKSYESKFSSIRNRYAEASNCKVSEHVKDNIDFIKRIVDSIPGLESK